MSEKKSWVVYCLATTEGPVRTYIGATVDPDRRLQQHNGQRSGGARATAARPGEWYRVCYVKGFTDNHAALSFEWHWKRASAKAQGDPLTRRRKGLDALLQKHPSLEVVYE